MGASWVDGGGQRGLRERDYAIHEKMPHRVPRNGSPLLDPRAGRTHPFTRLLGEEGESILAVEVKAGVPAGAAQSQTDVREFLRLVLRQKWVILGTFLAAVAITVFGTLSSAKLYEATATLEYDPNPPKPLGDQVEDMASPASNFLAGKEWYQTQNTIIASRTIAQRVVERLALHRDPDFMGVTPEKRASWTGVTPDEASKRILDVLTVRQERDTRVTRISVISGSPERATLLANAIADAYMDWVMEQRLGSTVRAVEWLSGQLDDVSRRLAASEHAVHDFRRANNVLSVSLADQQNGVTQTINSFNAALTEATTRRIGVEAKLRQLEWAVQEDPLQVHARLVSDSTAVSELRKRYHEAVVLRDGLAKRYGPQHPEMRSIQQQIDTLVASARHEIAGLVEVLRAELREVRDVERGLRQAKQETQNAGLDLNLHEIDYNRLERERANTEKLYGVLLQRTTETNLTRLLRVSPVRLVDRAVVSRTPIRPRPVLNMAVGVMLGLLGGLGLAVLRVNMDRTVREPDEIVALGATVLGLVPAITSDNKGPAYGGTAPGRRGRRGQIDRSGQVAKDLVVHVAPHSAVAECCRTIRTNLAFMSTDTPLRAIAVTSPGPSEGKSTLAMSLAITMAHSGKRVLLLDTDMRRPRLHKAFGVNSRVGLTSVLAGERSMEESIQTTMVEGLWLLPCGPIPPNPSELLHTASFSRLLAQLKEGFDIVVLDSPPVGVVIDAAIIGPQVDGAIMVAKSGRTSRDALKHALRQMGDVGANILGCVLNDVDLSKQSGYGGYYYYRGGYYYANDEPGGEADGGGSGTPTSGAPLSPPTA